MKKILFLLAIASVILCSCGTVVTKSVAYKGVYDEKPLSVLFMPPINRSMDAEAKEYFHSTLNIPIAEAGYYVIPPFLSMEILKKESAYDAELFIDAPLAKFGEVFGADLAVFTIIHKWDKSKLVAKVYVEVENIVKSIKTNEILFSRRGDVTYDASVSTGVGGVWGVLADMAASAINTAATKYVDVARVCNAYTFKDLPAGMYSSMYGLDGSETVGKQQFKVKLNSKYR
jgi:hypothetical protein